MKKINTVKPVFFACPLFREFRDHGGVAKITGREYSNDNYTVLVLQRTVRIDSAGKNAKIKGAKIIS
jgi:hypothetical protein